jgi:K+-sensing histidine kinase KdpD
MTGLSACQGIIQEHRGRMWLEQHKQDGITVNVELPTVSSVLQSATRTAPLPA